jgi:hypothetical protein
MKFIALLGRILFSLIFVAAGGALLVAHFGAGPLSVDAWLKSRGTPTLNQDSTKSHN